MAVIIHARTRDDGRIEYRLWSTVSAEYLTGPMRQERLREVLRERAIKSAIEAFDAEIDGRIRRAASSGSSADFGGSGAPREWQKS